MLGSERLSLRALHRLARLFPVPARGRPVVSVAQLAQLKSAASRLPSSSVSAPLHRKAF